MKNLTDLEIKTLFSNYGKTSDNDIKSLLEDKKIVPVFPHFDRKLKNFGPHEVDDATIKTIKDEPRRSIHFFIPGEYRLELEDFKTIVVLVEKRSDYPAFSMGEVIDQLKDEDKKIVKGFFFDFASMTQFDEDYNLALVALYKEKK